MLCYNLLLLIQILDTLLVIDIIINWEHFFCLFY
jgi:hypothetical protein